MRAVSGRRAHPMHSDRPARARRTRVAVAVTVAAVAALATACGAESMVYEPLLQYNLAKPNQTYPWLATSYAFSNGDKTLTFQLRHGVKWSDGKPFTSADVVFTFDMMKKYPTINTLGVSFSTVSAPNPYEVVFTFPSPAPDHQPAGHHPDAQPGLLAAGTAQDRQAVLPRLRLQHQRQPRPPAGTARLGGQLHPPYPADVHQSGPEPPLLQLPARPDGVPGTEPDPGTLQ